MCVGGWVWSLLSVSSPLSVYCNAGVALWLYTQWKAHRSSPYKDLYVRFSLRARNSTFVFSALIYRLEKKTWTELNCPHLSFSPLNYSNIVTFSNVETNIGERGEFGRLPGLCHAVARVRFCYITAQPLRCSEWLLGSCSGWVLGPSSSKPLSSWVILSWTELDFITKSSS